MKIGVTVSKDASKDLIHKAKEAARELNLPWMERRDTLEETGGEDCEGLLEFTRKCPVYRTRDNLYKFHLGTAKLRIAQMKHGHADRLVKLLPDKEYLTVVDATFGAGGDSIVLSWALQGKGQIISLEKSPVLWVVGQAGISGFSDADEDVLQAIRRIHLIHDDFAHWLQQAKSNSVDVVYFDTMFRHPVKKDINNRNAFRNAACYDVLTEDVLAQAVRAARYRVIVKERPFSPVFKNPAFTYVDSKKGQSTAYGVIVCQNKD